MPPTHMFLIDVSATAMESGTTAAACNAVSQVLQDLQGDCPIYCFLWPPLCILLLTLREPLEFDTSRFLANWCFARNAQIKAAAPVISVPSSLSFLYDNGKPYDVPPPGTC